jgi:hypothetical protein
MTPHHAPKQGITLMIDLGNRMQPINLDRSLVKHTILLGIAYIVAVLVYSCQNLCKHKEKYVEFLINGRHGLTPMYIINYPTYTPHVAVSLEYGQSAVTEWIGENIFLAKSDGYPM